MRTLGFVTPSLLVVTALPKVLPVRFSRTLLWSQSHFAVLSRKRSSFQRKCFNARSEDVDTKATYREAFKRRRCLLPAGEFFEKGHYFRFADDRPFAFAGLWESWRGGEGKVVEFYTLLTTEGCPSSRRGSCSCVGIGSGHFMP